MHPKRAVRRGLALATLALFFCATAAPASAAAETGAQPARIQVKGIYVNPWTAGDSTRMAELLELIGRTELNAVVIDFKDDNGYLTGTVPNGSPVPAGTVKPYIGDLPGLMAELKARDIYAIARIVAFKDSQAALNRPDWAAAHTGGGVWRDSGGAAWLDPYNTEVWDYVVAAGRQAAEAGFDEIQFDYVRFPSDGDLNTIVYPKQDQRTRARVIADFLSYASAQLRPVGVRVAADVFGLVTSFQDDMGIGQRLEEIAAAVDIVSPMLYPSHYSKGNLGLPDPEAAPSDTVYRSLKDASGRLEKAGLSAEAELRPWIQDFSVRVPYRSKEVSDQIRAVKDAGLQGWMLWNAASRYTEAALAPPEPPPYVLQPEQIGQAVTIGLNGQAITNPYFDVNPFVRAGSGRTMVPLRFVSEALGARVDWNQEMRMVTTTWNGTVVQVTLGQTQAIMNGLPVTLDQPPLLYEGRTLVPLRFLAEAFGAQVHWDGARFHVEVALPGAVCSPAYCGN